MRYPTTVELLALFFCSISPVPSSKSSPFPLSLSQCRHLSTQLRKRAKKRIIDQLQKPHSSSHPMPGTLSTDSSKTFPTPNPKITRFAPFSTFNSSQGPSSLHRHHDHIKRRTVVGSPFNLNFSHGKCEIFGIARPDPFQFNSKCR